ncbi:PEGA domain-containing protein [Hyalangium minutum]|uniref:PEGA domain-containing protein n=1 Tax=Hyalangium minutum TaxID=394096 RepID=A0A085WTP1_9BACT|nr:PEGA domain-containing protein [Hyalangium minutum]KFE71054.1 hypothetical protein DB31_3184 [Hyalangium minutum]
MSNAKDPQQDEMMDALMGRAQETEHVQSRFSNLQAPGQSPSGQPDQPGARGSGTPVSTGTVSVHQPLRDKVGTFLPSTEGGLWKVAGALRLGAAGFGLMTAVLFVMPELKGTFQAPSSFSSPSSSSPSDSGKQPTYKTIAPTLDTPAANPEQVITEQSAAFDGASVLMIESEQSGVSVRVDGNDQGNTPVSLTLDCLPGKPIKVEVSRKGYERAQHLTFCRPDTMIKLYARLRKVEKAGGAK